MHCKLTVAQQPVVFKTIYFQILFISHNLCFSFSLIPLVILLYLRLPYRLPCEIRKRGAEKKCDWLRQEKLREGAAQKKPWTPKPPKKKRPNYCGK